jgi:hypothetical protein
VGRRLVIVAVCRDGYQGPGQDGDRRLGTAAWVPAFMAMPLNESLRILSSQWGIPAQNQNGQLPPLLGAALAENQPSPTDASETVPVGP